MTAQPASPEPSLYRAIGRSDSARLAPGMTQPLTDAEIEQIRGLGDRLDLDEVREVYLPLSRLLSLYASSAKQLGAATSRFLDEPDTTTPFVLGIAGSVAVGKSTVAGCCRSCSAAGRTHRASNSSRPTGSSTRTPSSSAAGSCGARDSRSRMTGARAPRLPHAWSRAAPPKPARRSTRTCATTSCPTSASPYAGPTS